MTGGNPYIHNEKLAIAMIICEVIDRKSILNQFEKIHEMLEYSNSYLEMIIELTKKLKEDFKQ